MGFFLSFDTNTAPITNNNNNRAIERSDNKKE